MPKHLEGALSCLEQLSHLDLEAHENEEDVRIVRDGIFHLKTRITELEHEQDEARADYGILSDDYKQLQIDNVLLREENERLKAINEDIGYTLTHGCMKYVEGGTTVIDKCPVLKENEHLRASDAFVDSLRADKLGLADEIKRLERIVRIRDRTIDILAITTAGEKKICGDCPEQEIKHTSGCDCIRAAQAQARAELDLKPEALRDEKPEVKP